MAGQGSWRSWLESWKCPHQMGVFLKQTSMWVLRRWFSVLGVEPNIVVFDSPNYPILIGFSIIFTIHFGYPYFLG